jgi:hypothetical protein
MKFSIVIVMIIIHLLNYGKIDSKKKISKKKEHKNMGEINRQKNIKNADTIRPSDISRELFCDACQAIIIEALNNLRNLKKESDIIFYLSNRACSQEKYENYHFSKPEMEIACEVFMGEYYDEVEKLLVERNPKSDTKETLIKNLCYNQIEACNGVDLSKIKPIESEIVNGELYDIENVEETYQMYPTIEEVNFDDGEEDDIHKEKNESEL